MNETDTTPFPYDRISPELGKFMNVRFRLRSQLVDATHALNLLAGVSNPNVLRGRSFN